MRVPDFRQSGGRFTAHAEERMPYRVSIQRFSEGGTEKLATAG
jgi:hypothetical protein